MFRKLSLVLILSLSFFSVLSFAEVSSPIDSVAEGTCRFWEDEQKIPHLKAPSERVAMGCMGYAQGRYRAWQMDYFRKTAQGRKAEILGTAQESIRSDFFFRLLGLRQKAEELFQKMKEPEKELLRAYSRGVNRGFQEAFSARESESGSYEFKKLGYLPEDWSPEDTLALILLQSFDQTRRSFETQIRESGYSEKWGKNASELFNEDHVPWQTPILKEGEYSKDHHPIEFKQESGVEAFKAAHAEFKIPDSLGGVGAGSNNWVLSPKKSASGKAWLANDPHLKLGHPPFWFWLHIQAGDVDAIGATFPGVPVIVSGTNRQVSWGLTNAFLPASRLSLVSESELKEAKVSFPVIWVKFWKVKLPFIFKSFRRTPGNLPILPLPAPEGKAVVLRWSALDLKPEEITALLQVMKAKSVREMDQVLSQVGVPSWNYVFADDQGEIGYRAIGRIPRFDRKMPWGIPTESLSAVEHSPAFAHPLEPGEMPHLMNPQRGFVATANNRHWPSDSQWNSGKAQALSLRAFRIEELLNQTAKHDRSSIQAIQCDVQVVDARYLLPPLMKALDSVTRASSRDQVVTRALSLLHSWDYQAHLDCEACGVYERWVSLLSKSQNLNRISLYQKLLESPVDPRVQEAVVESFEIALKDLGSDQSFKRWGQIHLNSFSHLLGSDVSQTKAIGTPGAEFSVNPGTAEWLEDHFNHTDGASQRMVVEMTRPPQVYSVVAGPNHDIDSRDLSDPQTEWQKWLHCEQQKRIFPVDWTQVPSREIVLEGP